MLCEVIILAGRTKGQMDVWWGESSLEVVKHSGTNNQLSAPPALSPVWNHFSSPPPTHFLTLMFFLTHFLTLYSSPFYCVLSCSPSSYALSHLWVWDGASPSSPSSPKHWLGIVTTLPPGKILDVLSKLYITEFKDSNMLQAASSYIEKKITFTF